MLFSSYPSIIFVIRLLCTTVLNIWLKFPMSLNKVASYPVLWGVVYCYIDVSPNWTAIEAILTTFWEIESWIFFYNSIPHPWFLCSSSVHCFVLHRWGGSKWGEYQGQHRSSGDQGKTRGCWGERRKWWIPVIKLQLLFLWQWFFW